MPIGRARHFSTRGPGGIGDYRDCSLDGHRQGQFLPARRCESDARRRSAQLDQVAEDRVEVIAAARHRGRRCCAALRAAHPYEEPAFDVFELATFPGPLGLGPGRQLAEPPTLREFTARVARRAAAHRRGVCAPRAIPDATDPHGRGLRRCRRLATLDAVAPLGRRRLRHRRPAPPSGRRASARRWPGAGRRRALGERVPVVRAGQGGRSTPRSADAGLASAGVDRADRPVDGRARRRCSAAGRCP